jgi:hypothetical protein
MVTELKGCGVKNQVTPARHHPEDSPSGKLQGPMLSSEAEGSAPLQFRVSPEDRPCHCVRVLYLEPL